MVNKVKVSNFLKKKRTVVCFISLSICIFTIMAIFAASLKRNYFYVIGGTFDKPPMLVDETTVAEFGTNSLSKHEYNFLYYSTLYSLYPELKSKKFTQISNYINSEEYEEGKSIAQAVQDFTEETIIKMYSYLQDAADKGISIDSLENTETYIAAITQEAKKMDLTLDEYLSTYYGEGSSLDKISSVVTNYQSYKIYESDILKKAAADISDEEFETAYQRNRDAYDLYDIFALTYSFNEDLPDAERNKVKDAITQCYENVHKSDDFIKLGQEFCKNNSDNGKGNVTSEILTVDYYALFTFGNDILNWVTDKSRKQDAVALFETQEGYVVVYFNGRRRDERTTYNGIAVSAEREIEFVDGAALQPTLYSEDELFPYYNAINDFYNIVSKLDDSERTSENIAAMASKYNTARYTKNEKFSLSPTILENSLLTNIANDPETLTWAETCKDGSFRLDKAPPHYSVVYIESKGLPNYKAVICASRYEEARSNIENSYYPMFSNVSYS